MLTGQREQAGEPARVYPSDACGVSCRVRAEGWPGHLGGFTPRSRRVLRDRRDLWVPRSCRGPPLGGLRQDLATGQGVWFWSRTGYGPLAWVSNPGPAGTPRPPVTVGTPWIC